MVVVVVVLVLVWSIRFFFFNIISTRLFIGSVPFIQTQTKPRRIRLAVVGLAGWVGRWRWSYVMIY